MAKFVASGVTLLSTNNTIVFQNPNASYLVLSLYGATVSDAPANVDISVSGSLFNTFLTKNNQIGNGESVDFIANRVVLASGDTLQARSSLASGIDIFASLYEINS